MFGYVTIYKDELKVKDYDFYRSCYCGLCQALRKRHGITASLTLTYDMTFMTLLLSALYEEPFRQNKVHCPVHPFKKQTVRMNKMTNYAADMSILLSYHSMRDNWQDEHSAVGLAMSTALKKAYNQVANQYPRQAAAVELYMKQIAACEQENDRSLDRAAGYTGTMLQALFVFKKDPWQSHLSDLAFYLGKFIYLMDAYDDLEQDKKKHNYNPWRFYEKQQDFEQRVFTILNSMGERTAREFEWLPILEHGEILRNIIYAGIWTKYTAVKEKRNESAAKAVNGEKHDV
jgi:hypothetical protein